MERGRVAAFELMINTPSIASLIRDNKTYRIANDIHTGSKFGMVSLEASLVRALSSGHDQPRGSVGPRAGSDVANQLLRTGRRGSDADRRSVLPSPPLSSLPAMTTDQQILDLFVDQGIMQRSQVEDVLYEIGQPGKSLLQVLVDFDIVTEDQLLPGDRRLDRRRLRQPGRPRGRRSRFSG